MKSADHGEGGGHHVRNGRNGWVVVCTGHAWGARYHHHRPTGDPTTSQSGVRDGRRADVVVS